MAAQPSFPTGFNRGGLQTADERFAVERLIQCAKIYAYALYELAK